MFIQKISGAELDQKRKHKRKKRRPDLAGAVTFCGNSF